MTRKSLLIAALVSAAAVAPAQAGNYVFHYYGYADTDYSDFAGPMAATIFLTTSDVLNTLGGYDILSASGTIDGAAVVGLEANPNQPDFYGDGHFDFNNVIYTSGAPLDGFGFDVTTAQATFNFGYDGNDVGGFFGISTDGSTHISPRTGQPVTTFHVTLGSASLAAVPEPASWAMMLAGFGLAGTALRRRRTAVSFA